VRDVAKPSPPRNRRRLIAAFAGAGSVLAVLASVTSLFDWVGGKVDPPPPAEIDANIVGVTLRSASQELGDYLLETHQSTAGLSRFELAEPGYSFGVRVRLKGNKGVRLPLRWAVVRAKTGVPLRDPLYQQEGVVFKPRGPDQARTWPLWVPYPERKGTYRLRTTLVDPKGEPQDEAMSEPFTLKRAPAP
jgi:hypothetical protein